MISELAFERWISLPQEQREKGILVHRKHMCKGTVVRKDTVYSGKCKLIHIVGAQCGSEKGGVEGNRSRERGRGLCSTLSTWNFILEVAHSVAQGPTISE